MKRFLLLGLFAIFIVNTVGCEGLYDNPAPEEFEEVLEYEFHKDVKYYDKDLASWLSLVNDTTMFIGSGMPSEHVTYGAVPNMMNMDLWASYNYEIPTYFIYFVSKPLTKFLPVRQKNNHGFTASYSYVFDDEGYVIKAVEDFDSPFDGSGQEIFTFEYEIY